VETSSCGFCARMNLSLVDAFRAFGAKPNSRLRCASAIAADGAMVLNCSYTYFVHPARGVLRYEDRLSRETANPDDSRRLSEHLTLARDGELPIRMVVTSRTDPNSPSPRSFYVRPDLTGKVVKFDGDHFIVDFTRPEEAETVVAAIRRK
jgi:hypothetical protein